MVLWTSRCDTCAARRDLSPLVFVVKKRLLRPGRRPRARRQGQRRRVRSGAGAAAASEAGAIKLARLAYELLERDRRAALRGPSGRARCVGGGAADPAPLR